MQIGLTGGQQEVSRPAEESEGEWDEMEMSQGDVGEAAGQVRQVRVKFNAFAYENQEYKKY